MIFLQSDIMLVFRQIETTSSSDIEEMLDSILRHFITGKEFAEGLKERALFRSASTGTDAIENIKRTITGQ